MIAFVVAIAGMMLPAYSKEGTKSDKHSVREEVAGEEEPTLDLEPRLRLDLERSCPQVGGSDNEVKGVVVVLVETEGVRTGWVDTFPEPLDPVRQQIVRNNSGRSAWVDRSKETRTEEQAKLTNRQTIQTNPPIPISSDP